MTTIAEMSIGRLKSMFKLSAPVGSMLRLNAVTLDLWDTLITEIPRKNPGLRKHRMNLIRAGLKEFGFDYDMPIIEKAYMRSEEFCNDMWCKNRDIPLDDHFLFMLSCIDSDLPWKLNKDGLRALRKSYSEAIMQMPPVLLPHAREVLEHLSGRGYRIGLISNTGRTPGSVLRQLLERMNIARYFDLMIFSDEVLVRKPEKQIFNHAIRGLSTLPRLSIHVGDDPEADFQGAKRAGMNALLIDAERKAIGIADTISSLEDLLTRL